jgi:murein DD-endopeptidase MepM/ murein hydrolase activator NlpD
MPEGTDDSITHRPLPSVGIPLLRDEVRATRNRQLIALAVLGTVALVGLSALVVGPWLLWPRPVEEVSAAAAGAPAVVSDQLSLDELEALLGDDGPPPPPPEPEPEPVEEEQPGGEGTRVSRPFGQARGFRPALTALGCSGAEADALIGALEGVMDFRRCRPDHELIVERDASGRLERFEYRAGVTQIYEVVRDLTGELTGRQVEVPVEVVRIGRIGTVQTSLGAALDAAGLGRTLVGIFVETFEGAIDFNTRTRAGDTFRVLVDERRVNGELLEYGTVHAITYQGARAGEHEAFWYAPREDLAEFYGADGRALHGGWLRTPLRFDHISSPFDPRRLHPILRRIHPHNGVDYAAGTGTPVWAAAAGTVTFVGRRGANGNLISLRHPDGYETFYAHLSRFARGLERGDEVEQRQVIGYVGSTGRSTGPHLHFGLKRHGRFIDPQSELNGPGRMLPPAFRGPFRRRVRELREALAALEPPAVVDASEATAEAETEADAEEAPTPPPATEAMD